MNEIICSITSAIEEGRSWGHTDKEIADYIYAKHIRPLETKLAEAPEPRAAFLEGFMLTTKSRNGENPFAGDYAEAWKAIASHAGVSQRLSKPSKAPRTKAKPELRAISGAWHRTRAIPREKDRT